MESGVAIKGGYRGLDDDDPPGDSDIRDATTILTGYLGDGPPDCDDTDVSYHVVRAVNVDDTALLEGFVITLGFAIGEGDDANGGGIFISNVEAEDGPVIRDCIVTKNYADNLGGGIYSAGGSPTIESGGVFPNSLKFNTAGIAGGGAYFVGGNPSVTCLHGVQNTAEGTFLAPARGGDMCFVNTAPGTLQFCRFLHGFAGTVNEGYGGGICIENAPLQIESLDLLKSSATSAGGGVYCTNSDAVINHLYCCGTVTAGGGGAMFVTGGSDVALTDACLHLGTAGSGGAMAIVDARVFARYCSFTGSVADSVGGGVAVSDSSPDDGIATSFDVQRSILWTNQADNGAAMHIAGASVARLANCAIFGNPFPYSPSTVPDATNGNLGTGGGIHFAGDADAVLHLTNCTFTGNHASSGGALHLEPTNAGADIEIRNCTFSGNLAIETVVPGVGGAIRAIDATLVLANVVLWDNRVFPDDTGEAAQISATGSLTVLNSCIDDEAEDNNFPFGGTNIDANPDFEDPTGPDVLVGSDDDDVRISPMSPCVNEGDNAELALDEVDLDGDGNTTELIMFDRDMRTRVRAAVVDIGAFEAPSCVSQDHAGCDMNCDGDVDFFDVDFFLLALFDPEDWETEEGNECDPEFDLVCVADVNGDGAVNFLDIDPFTDCLFANIPRRLTIPLTGCASRDGPCEGGFVLGDVCDTVGACCYQDGPTSHACIITTPENCNSLEGTFFPGSICQDEDVDCVP